MTGKSIQNDSNVGENPAELNLTPFGTVAPVGGKTQSSSDQGNLQSEAACTGFCDTLLERALDMLSFLLRLLLHLNGIVFENFDEEILHCFVVLSGATIGFQDANHVPGLEFISFRIHCW